MIEKAGPLRYNIWEHSATVRDLYARRCRLEAPEMTCHAQAAELLAPFVRPGDTLLDAGCGSGYFYHSLAKRGLPVEYHGIDSAPSLVGIGRSILPAHGLPADRLKVMPIEELGGEADHVVCMNVLTNIDNYHRPLDRLLQAARRTVTLRESLGREASYLYVRDKYLDEGVRLSVHVNTYAEGEFLAFIEERGFKARTVIDVRTGGKPEMVIDYPHLWTFVVAVREQHS